MVYMGFPKQHLVRNSTGTSELLHWYLFHTFHSLCSANRYPWQFLFGKKNQCIFMQILYHYALLYLQTHVNLTMKKNHPFTTIYHIRTKFILKSLNLTFSMLDNSLKSPQHRALANPSLCLLSLTGSMSIPFKIWVPVFIMTQIRGTCRRTESTWTLATSSITLLRSPSLGIFPYREWQEIAKDQTAVVLQFCSLTRQEL